MAVDSRYMSRKLLKEHKFKVLIFVHELKIEKDITVFVSTS